MSKTYQFVMSDPTDPDSKPDEYGCFREKDLPMMKRVIELFYQRSDGDMALVIQELPDSMATINNPLPN
jgi:hypothetical protein